MFKAFKQAANKCVDHAARFRDFDTTFPVSTVAKWSKDWDRWMADPTSKPDPFEEVETRE